ncbi:hypothetical protein F183_A17030 [Bryobacterales bacterium F-183]|nr:hypothetical protein F183_A17030 [Bryobacterales bacterium F-183]
MSRILTFLLIFVFCGFGQELELISSDIDNFWRAYDEGTSSGNRVEAFQRLYLDAASPGLRDFVRLRIGSASALAAAVERYPKFYESIRKSTQSIEGQRKVMQLYASRFRGLYPETRFPPVYFLIGRLSSGGTLSDNGLLIGAEVFALGPDVDASEIAEQNPAFYRAMGTSLKLPHIVMHELVHAQLALRTQPRIPDLLTRVLIEGAADFVANAVTGRTALESRADFAQVNRDELLAKFQEDLVRTPGDISGWLYNYSTVGVSKPADLGYWIGEEICRDYFAQALDKQEALRNILTMRDPEGIVRGSSFAYLIP